MFFKLSSMQFAKEIVIGMYVDARLRMLVEVMLIMLDASES